jgi:mycothiol synthase
MVTKEKIEFNIRSARWEDAEAVTKIMYAVNESIGDVATADTQEELEHNWRNPSFNLEKDAFVAENQHGEVIGYCETYNGHENTQIDFEAYVYPQYSDTPVTEMLLFRAEQRALEIVPLAAPNTRVFIHSAMGIKENEYKALHEKLGYTAVRYFWRMEIKLESAPQVQPLPNGVEFRPFVQAEHARLVWEADNEAFRDHWGSHDSKYEEWHQRKLERPEYDPTLWLIAWEGDQIAGFSQNRYLNEIGWVGTLGVRRPWRKKGLGLALLTHSFAEFYKRGIKSIGLGVDAANPSGATRLYEKAGMSVANSYVVYEKELRAGKE